MIVPKVAGSMLTKKKYITQVGLMILLLLTECGQSIHRYPTSGCLLPYRSDPSLPPIKQNRAYLHESTPSLTTLRISISVNKYLAHACTHKLLKIQVLVEVSSAGESNTTLWTFCRCFDGLSSQAAANVLQVVGSGLAWGWQSIQ